MNPVAAFHVGQLVWCKKLGIYGFIAAVFVFPWAPTVYHLNNHGDTGFEESDLMVVAP